MTTKTVFDTRKDTLLTPGLAPWKEVEAVLSRHYFEPDLQAARAFYAGIAAHRLTGQPVWPMLVGPPGSMKTELLNGLQILEEVKFVDQITEKTFISGHIVDEGDDVPPGLLHRIGRSGILVYPDFSTIMAMRQEARGSILADMRRIYDGQLSKEYGTSNNLKTREWRGRITFAVAATPEVDSHMSIFQSLGERFVMIRWGRPNGVQAALAAMNQDSARARQELQAAISTLFGQLPQLEPTVSDNLRQMIAAMADFVTRARTHVSRSGYSKEILYMPEAEAPTRLSQQLTQLAKGSALIDGRETVDDSDYTLVKRVAFDCIPTLRRRVVLALTAGNAVTPLAPPSTLKYCVEDLQAVGLLQERRLSSLSLELLTMARMMGEFTRTPPPSGMVH